MAADDHRPPLRAVVWLAPVGVLLVLGLITAAIRPPWQFDPIVINLPHRTLPPPKPPVQQTAAPTASARPTAPPASPIDLSWLPWVLVGVLAAAAAFAIFLLAI